MDDDKKEQSREAIVLGGSGENACQCVSAASWNIKLEVLPEVRELSEKLTGKAELPGGKPTERKTEKTPQKSPEKGKGSSAGSAGTSDSRETGKKKKPRATKKTALIAAAALFVMMAAFAIYEAVKIAGIVDSVNYVPGGLSFDEVNVLVSESELGGFVSHTDETKNIMLCGCDVDENGISRTDSMIILSIDHAHKKIKMTSLMRDMYLQIPGHGKNKLNASFTFGGGDLLLKTVYANFGMKIEKYVCVDYAVFAAVVDDLGGVEIDIEEMELEQFNKYVRGGKKNRLTRAGRYNLNGQQALSYCRIRKVGSDTARTARQRRVLNEILKKSRSLSPLRAQKILGMVAPFVTTNMTRDEMTSLLLEGLQCLDYDTMGLRIPMDGTWSDKRTAKAWYVEVKLNQNARYLNHFIYGDDETAQALADRQQKSDEQNSQYSRNTYEKNKNQNN